MWVWIFNTLIKYKYTNVQNFRSVLASVFTYGSSCSSNSSCDTSKSLYCIGTGQSPGTCTCDVLYYWNGINCTKQLTVNASCTSSSQCRSDLYLYCNTSHTNLCVCNENQYWNGSGSICGMIVTISIFPAYIHKEIDTIKFKLRKLDMVIVAHLEHVMTPYFWHVNQIFVNVQHHIITQEATAVCFNLFCIS